VNQCNFIGRLGQNPEPIGANGCKFSLAIDDYNSQTKAKETVWIEFVAFGRTAEIIQQYAEKGRQVRVTAKFRWRDREVNGRKYHDPSFLVDDFELLSGGASALSPGAPSGGGSFTGAPVASTAPAREEEKLW
jgi:single-strand DNA-binding protein